MFVALNAMTDSDAYSGLEALTICLPASSGPLKVIWPPTLVNP